MCGLGIMPFEMLIVGLWHRAEQIQTVDFFLHKAGFVDKYANPSGDDSQIPLKTTKQRTTQNSRATEKCGWRQLVNPQRKAAPDPHPVPEVIGPPPPPRQSARQKKRKYDMNAEWVDRESSFASDQLANGSRLFTYEAIVVRGEDYDRLNDGQFLNDSLIEMQLK